MHLIGDDRYWDCLSLINWTRLYIVSTAKMPPKKIRFLVVLSVID